MNTLSTSHSHTLTHTVIIISITLQPLDQGHILQTLLISATSSPSGFYDSGDNA